MAVSFNRDRSTTADQGQKRADAFANLYLPKKNADGSPGRYKFGAIALYKDKLTEKKLIEMFEKDPEGVAKLLVGKMTIEYRSATPTEAADLDL
jgi:hypothetical protein